ncbi:MAG: hypothetical protein ROO76_21720 [Terriglobia bacterium]|nr:hypothetical protein [Terriglobia bacterium]
MYEQLREQGEIRIPKNSKLIGHLAEGQRKTMGNGQFTLWIIFRPGAHA